MKSQRNHELVLADKSELLCFERPQLVISCSCSVDCSYCCCFSWQLWIIWLLSCSTWSGRTYGMCYMDEESWGYRCCLFCSVLFWYNTKLPIENDMNWYECMCSKANMSWLLVVGSSTFGFKSAKKASYMGEKLLYDLAKDVLRNESRNYKK